MKSRAEIIGLYNQHHIKCICCEILSGFCSYWWVWEKPWCFQSKLLTARTQIDSTPLYHACNHLHRWHTVMHTTRQGSLLSHLIRSLGVSTSPQGLHKLATSTNQLHTPWHHHSTKNPDYNFLFQLLIFCAMLFVPVSFLWCVHNITLLLTPHFLAIRNNSLPVTTHIQMKKVEIKTWVTQCLEKYQ